MAFGVRKGLLWYATHFHAADSVPETGFYGTEYARRAKNSLLGYVTHFQRRLVLKTGFPGTEGIFGTGMYFPDLG